MAVTPALSLALLSASICTKRERIAKTISRIMVEMAEMMAGVLLGIFFLNPLQEKDLFQGVFVLVTRASIVFVLKP